MKTKFVYDPKNDGNIFKWILEVAAVTREMRQEQIDAIKKAARKPKGLG